MRFKILQLWSGIIKEVHEDTFWARLSDITEPDNPDEYAELLKSEVSQQDLPLILEGTAFNWYIVENDEQIKSFFEFMDLGVWTEEEVEEAKKEAEEWAAFFAKED